MKYSQGVQGVVDSGVSLVRSGEEHFGLYKSIVGMMVKAGYAVDMLNNMAGKRGDTPLMKAAANGTQFMAGTGRGRVGG